MEFDGRVDKIREMIKPLTVKTSIIRRKDVYYLKFEIKDPRLLQPGWHSLDALVKPLVKANFPHCKFTSNTEHKVLYRLGNLFDFLTQSNNPI